MHDVMLFIVLDLILQYYVFINCMMLAKSTLLKLIILYVMLLLRSVSTTTCVLFRTIHVELSDFYIFCQGVVNSADGFFCIILSRLLAEAYNCEAF
jgi:hypothetical protein